MKTPTTEIISNFHQSLKCWGKVNKAYYPWRYIDDPYKILVSEFMLHRTRADQVAPVYLTMIEKYPDLGTFCNGAVPEILEIMAPLGLQWRTSAMVNALQEINNLFGKIPLKSENLLAIKGIGPYIANATLCFSTNQPLPLIDTNIIRVVGRFTGLNICGEPRRRKGTTSMIELMLDREDPKSFYYSVIDLAHMLCKTKNPSCSHCPLALSGCDYQVAGKQRV